jgi:hypothetical protein
VDRRFRDGREFADAGVALRDGQRGELTLTELLRAPKISVVLRVVANSSSGADGSIMHKKTKSPVLSLLSLICALAGCASSPVQVPPNAELVWAGDVNSSPDFGVMTRHHYGELYLVDDATGHIQAIRTHEAESPSFSFPSGAKMYHIYFVEID